MLSWSKRQEIKIKKNPQNRLLIYWLRNIYDAILRTKVNLKTFFFLVLLNVFPRLLHTLFMENVHRNKNILFFIRWC